MTDDMERMLRNALDSVDRGRRWAMLGVGALFLAALVVFSFVFQMITATTASGVSVDVPAGNVAQAAAPLPGASKLTFMLFAAHILFVAACTAVVMMHVSRMTKAILRAIDLKRPE